MCSAVHKETGAVRAVKELKKSKKNKAKNDLLLKEFYILKRLDHPNIVKMYGEYIKNVALRKIWMCSLTASLSALIDVLSEVSWTA